MDTDESRRGSESDESRGEPIDETDAARRRDGPALVEIVTDSAEPQASEWMTRDRN